MRIKWKFPIRYKILSLLSILVFAAIALYLYLASRLFHEDKTLLIYELNQTNVRTLSADVETYLKRVLEKLRFIPYFSEHLQEHFKILFANEDELIRVTILESQPELSPKVVFTYRWLAYLEQYGKNEAYLDEVRQNWAVPFETVQQKGIWIRNVTPAQEGSPPMMTVATAVGPNRVIYADVRLDRLLSSFSHSGISQLYAIDSEGFVLAHSDQNQVNQQKNLSQDPLIQFALLSKVRSEVRSFDEQESEHAKDGNKSKSLELLQDGKATKSNEYLGSFYKLGLGQVVVASKIPAGEAFAAARVLIRKSLLYAAVVITVAFLISLLFSHLLTLPIQKILEAMKKIIAGDFSSLIQVSSHDELAVLAASFNSMTVHLGNARNQIEEANRELEKKVVERTSRLEAQTHAIKDAQETLLKTTRLASVGEVAGRAAHEVLNPLTNISARLEKIREKNFKADLEDLTLFKEIANAWSEDLKEKKIDGLIETLKTPSSTLPGKTLLEEDLENLKAICSDMMARQTHCRDDIEFLLKEANRISKIVNGMRKLTRVSGRRKVIEMNALLSEALATMEDGLRKRKITSKLNLCPENPQILADRDELLQVFTNLIHNSMQAIDDAQRIGKLVGQPPMVWLDTNIVESKNQMRVLVRICDNGPGMPEDIFQKIFDAGFTTKSAEEGTGLGLSICRRFIRAFEGDIIVEKSIPGVQTTFLIDIPEVTLDMTGEVHATV